MVVIFRYHPLVADLLFSHCLWFACLCSSLFSVRPRHHFNEFFKQWTEFWQLASVDSFGNWNLLIAALNTSSDPVMTKYVATPFSVVVGIGVTSILIILLLRYSYLLRLGL